MPGPSINTPGTMYLTASAHAHGCQGLLRLHGLCRVPVRLLATGKKKPTYNSRCSLVVTDPTTNLPLISLTLGERTGPRIF
ncbi:hypothetical protein B0I35DRAFT_383625 [Stachybotrys elegans]|uniref:Uncharacterized protein n=1 Tax=Stachybotrys elegans TaxID=80388 RepID=A0A8K0SBH8_9HYPO|nr:hypothetical protein B0I35DRAFT_383625 [Stachybotrys elegans]